MQPAKYKQYAVALVFLLMIIPVCVKCVLTPKKFYWGIGWHLEVRDTLYGSRVWKAFHGGVQDSINNNLPQDIAVDIFGSVQRLLGKRYIPDSLGMSVIQQENDHLTFSSSEIPVEFLAWRIEKFHDLLMESDIRFVYVQAPGDVCKYDPQLPRGLPDHTNGRADALLGELKKRAVPTFDLREVFPHDAESYYSLFFRGDNHWNPLGMLLGAEKTVDFLKRYDSLNLELSALQPSQFHRKDYTCRFTGSQRKQTGRFFIPEDTIQCLTPKYPTRFSLFLMEDDGTEKLEAEHVSFADLWINEDNLRDGGSCYGTYSKNSPLKRRIVNEDTTSDVRVLLVGDSFITATAPFLANSCKELCTVGFSYGKPLEELVKRYKPDIVLFLYSPNLRGDILEHDYGKLFPAPEGSETQFYR